MSETHHHRGEAATVAAPPGRSIAQVAAAVRAGDLSALELTDAYLSRIAAYAEPLNVFRTVTAAAARRRAREVDDTVARGEDPGPLAGVPVALKDNIGVAGVPMTAATGFLRDNVATEDAAVTVRLRDAGAIFLGKLHMSEWAIGATTQNIHFGVGRNPWDPERSPGGSSGGSGAAIAADLALGTLGTDTGGSCRLPASLNGCVGLRPTFGRVSNRGTIEVAWSFDTIGPLARRAEDVAALLAVTAGYDHGDPTTTREPVDDYVAALDAGADELRVGVLGGTYRAAPLTGAIDAALTRAAAELAGAGVEVSDAMLEGHEAITELTADLMMAEAAAFHAERLAGTPSGFASDVLARLRRGESVTGAQYGRGRQQQRAWRRRVVDALGELDALLLPAAPIVAPLIAESDPLETTRTLAHFTAAWVLAGVPVLAVPIGFVDGLPVAMQLVGRPYGESALLRIAHVYQQATDWHLRRPALDLAGLAR